MVFSTILILHTSPRLIDFKVFVPVASNYSIFWRIEKIINHSLKKLETGNNWTSLCFLVLVFFSSGNRNNNLTSSFLLEHVFLWYPPKILIRIDCAGCWKSRSSRLTLFICFSGFQSTVFYLTVTFLVKSSVFLLSNPDRPYEFLQICFQTRNSPKLQAWFLSRAQSTALYLTRTIQLKSCGSWSLHRNPGSPKRPKIVDDFGASRYSKSRFFLTIGFIFSIKILIDSFLIKKWPSNFEILWFL